jgi:hypothetical protein
MRPSLLGDKDETDAPDQSAFCLRQGKEGTVSRGQGLAVEARMTDEQQTFWTELPGS